MNRAAPQPFTRTGLAWAVGLAAGSLVLAFLFQGLAGDLDEPASAGPDSYSYSALGHRGLVEFLGRSGIQVLRRRTPHAPAVDRSTAVLEVEPPPFPEASDDNASPRRIRGGAAFVLVLPKRVGAPSFRHPGWVGQTAPLAPDIVAEVAASSGAGRLRIARDTVASTACTTAWGERLTLWRDSPQWLAPAPGLRPVIARDSLMLVAELTGGPGGADTATASAAAGNTRFLVVADPDLINNAGLGRDDNARAVAGLFRALGVKRVVFDETLHHPPLRTGLVRELFRFPLVLALVQSVLLLGFLLWGRVPRFGKPAPPRADGAGRHALVDSIAHLLAATGRPAETLQTYFEQMVRSAGDRQGLPAGLTEGTLVERLSEIGHRRGIQPDIGRVSKVVMGLQLERGRRADRAVRIARRVHRWHKEMTDELG